MGISSCISTEEGKRLRARTGRVEGQISTIISEQLSQLSKEFLDARTQRAAAQAHREEIARLGEDAGEID